MQHSSYRALSASLSDLSRAQIDKVFQALNALRHKLDSFSALSGNDPTSCRYCHATKLVRFGFQNGLQRFICKSCSKTCCATTGTPLARLSGKHQLAGYADCMSKGLTLRQTCAELKMSLDRAFRWRHRMLQNPITHQPKAIKGILEVDETNFKKSRKGERGLGAVARKRGGRAARKGKHSSDFLPVLVGRARGQAYTVDRVLKSMAKTEIHAALVGSVDPDTTVLCMDSHKSFLEMGKMLGCATNIFVTTKAKPADFHVQNVNSYHERLKTWIDYKMRRVASKYMPSYLAWQRLRTWKAMSSSELIASALGRQIINL